MRMPGCCAECWLLGTVLQVDSKGFRFVDATAYGSVGNHKAQIVAVFNNVPTLSTPLNITIR